MSHSAESRSAVRGSKSGMERRILSQCNDKCNDRGGHQMCRPQFAAGVGHIDLAGLGRTPQDGAEAAMDCRSPGE